MQERNKINFSKKDEFVQRVVRVSHLEGVTLKVRLEMGEEESGVDVWGQGGEVIGINTPQIAINQQIG